MTRGRTISPHRRPEASIAISASCFKTVNFRRRSAQLLDPRPTRFRSTGWSVCSARSSSSGERPTPNSADAFSYLADARGAGVFALSTDRAIQAISGIHRHGRDNLDLFADRPDYCEPATGNLFACESRAIFYHKYFLISA